MKNTTNKGRLFNSIALKVEIYDTEATITRHKNGDVTVRDPFVRWVGNTGHLSHEKHKFTGLAARELSAIFSDNPPIINPGDPDEHQLTFGEFMSYYT